MAALSDTTSVLCVTALRKASTSPAAEVLAVKSYVAATANSFLPFCTAVKQHPLLVKQ